MSDLISHDALERNPLVTGWDNAWRATRLELADGRILKDTPDALSAAAPQFGPAAVAALHAFHTRQFRLSTRTDPLPCGVRTLVMGILNTTPDSFSDGGRWSDTDRAVEHGLTLAEQGAHLLDVGGESTRPGADPVPADEERRRTVPVIAALAIRCDLPISIDTTKADVAAAALDAGACMVNDVSALRDPAMAPLIAHTGAALCLMHMQGEPRTMQKNPVYADVVREVADFLRRAMARAADAGIGLEQLVVDPGIGFGKNLAHNTELIRRLPVLASLGRPILMGCSRKSLIQRALGLPLARRLHPTQALNVLSIVGRASIIRVHDVGEAV